MSNQISSPGCLTPWPLYFHACPACFPVVLECVGPFILYSVNSYLLRAACVQEPVLSAGDRQVIRKWGPWLSGADSPEGGDRQEAISLTSRVISEWCLKKKIRGQHERQDCDTQRGFLDWIIRACLPVRWHLSWGRDLAEGLLGRGTSRVFHTLNISYVPYGITFWDLSLNHCCGSLLCSHLSFCTFWQSAHVCMCVLYHIWSENGVWPMGFAWVTRTSDRISVPPPRSAQEQLLGELAQMQWTLF